MKKNRRILHLAALLSMAIFLLGMGLQPSWSKQGWTKTLESLPLLKADLKDFYRRPSLLIFSPKDRGEFVPIQLKDSVYVQNDRALISLEDMEAIIKENKLRFNPESKILTIQQIKRSYLAIDRPAYLEQDELKPLAVAPTIREGKVYLPLRFVLEKLGYWVNYNGQEAEILLVARDRVSHEIIAKDEIRKNRIRGQDMDGDKLEILSLEGQNLFGLSIEQKSQRSHLVRLDQKGQLRVSSEALPAFLGRDVFQDQKGDYYATGPGALYFLDMARGLFRQVEIPKMLEEAWFFGLDQGDFYAYNGREIFSYDRRTRALSKLADIGKARQVCLGGAKIFYLGAQGLESYSIQDGQSEKISQTSSPDYLEIIVLRGPYIFYMDYARSCLFVYDYTLEKQALVVPFSQEVVPQVSVTGNDYLLVDQGRILDLYEVPKASLRSLDLINMAGDLKKGKISWFWDGDFLQAYWENQDQAGGKAYNQVIRIHL